MGQAISNLIGAKKDEDLKETLELMMKMAEQKRQLFHDSILTSGVNTKVIPIKLVLNTYSDIQGNVSQDAKGISDGISEAIGSFVHGDIMSGLKTVLSKVVTAIVSDTTIGETIKTSYVIVLTKHGSIVRVDYELYKYKFRTESLVKLTESVLMITYSLSSVDLRVVDADTLVALIDTQYDGLKDEDFKLLKDRVYELKKEQKQDEIGIDK
jgi:hypothetical protein